MLSWGRVARNVLLGGVWIIQQLLAAGSGNAETVALPVQALAADTNPGAMKIDGYLDEAGWKQATAVDLIYEWRPGDNIEPPVETEVFVTYDKSHLYLAWVCHDDNPQDIRAHLMDRDDVTTLSQDDHVMVTIDTYNDERRGVQFRVNPLGVQADAIYSELGGIEDFSFDLIWKSAGRRHEDGYTVEVAIPFNQLRFSASDTPQTWGFDFQRSYPRSVRHRISGERHDRDRNCVLCQVTKLSGFASLSPGKNIELTPTLTTGRTEILEGPTGTVPRSSDENTEIGLNARYSPTPNVSLNLALNPDFSQVETDTAQLEINQRFALLFEEKRPFFLEGVDLFSTPMPAVFTRSIVDPDWGLKVTGKVNDHSLGLFVARDDINRFIVPGAQQSQQGLVEEKVDNGVLRYRKDVGKKSSLGFLWTGRKGEKDYRNNVFGPDAFLRFGKRHTLRVQYLATETRYDTEIAESLDQPTGVFASHAFLLGYNYNSRKWAAWFFANDRGELFRADNGFFPRANFSSINTGVQRTFWADNSKWLNEWTTFVRLRAGEQQNGQTIEEQIELSTLLRAKRQTFVRFDTSIRREVFEDVPHDDLLNFNVASSIQPAGSLRLELIANLRDEIDIVNNRVGEQWTVTPSIEWKPERRVNLQLEHTFRRLRLPKSAEQAAGDIFKVNLTQLRLVYNVNVRSFARLILQYRELTRDPELFPVPVQSSGETLNSQLLYSYKINPQTVLFAGYSDSRLAAGDLSLTETDRTFFLKIGYAWSP